MPITVKHVYFIKAAYFHLQASFSKCKPAKFQTKEFPKQKNNFECPNACEEFRTNEILW